MHKAKLLRRIAELSLARFRSCPEISEVFAFPDFLGRPISMRRSTGCASSAAAHCVHPNDLSSKRCGPSALARPACQNVASYSAQELLDRCLKRYFALTVILPGLASYQQGRSRFYIVKRWGLRPLRTLLHCSGWFLAWSERRH